MPTLQPEYRYQKKTNLIIDQLYVDYAPDHIYALVSGGHDSDTALHVAYSHSDITLDGVVHIDTGIGIPATRRFVKRRCSNLGLRYIEITGEEDAIRKREYGDRSIRERLVDPNPFPELVTEYYGTRYSNEEYAFLVKRYGFPGQPVHEQMYINLKEKPLQRFVSQHDGTVVLISGVRQAESQNRLENIANKGIQEKIGAVWVSPIMAWSDPRLRDYRTKHRIPKNPVVETLHMSGECLCGAYADREELELLRIFYPNVARYIDRLELEVFDGVEKGDIPEEYALWGHGGLSTAEQELRTDPEQTSFILCDDCEDRCTDEPYDMAGNPLSHVEAMLKRGWVNDHDPSYYCPDCNIVTTDAKTHREEVHPFDEDLPWDCRPIDRLESSRRNAVITRPDPDELIHCNVHHTWTAMNGVLQCRDCGAFNLSDGDRTVDDLHAPPETGTPITNQEAQESDESRPDQSLDAFTTT